MGVWDLIRTTAAILPVAGLLLVGLVIVVRSGGAGLGTSQGVQVALGNLGSLLLRVAGYVAGLVAVQHLIGFPLGLDW